MNGNWKIFKGTRQPHQGIETLPDPPPWRYFGTKKQDNSNQNSKSREEVKGSTFQIGEREVELVNAALYLRRPLLVTGQPGTGKSSLAYAIAYELQLGTVLKWSINTRTTLSEGLYRYDAIGRLQEVQIRQKKNLDTGDETDIGRYIQLGPLGTAFLPNEKPRVLLIDEIDKSDFDLPNDLLNIFEEGEFEIPELVRIYDRLNTVNVRTFDNHTAQIAQGQVTCTEFPLVILTSNGEREFPPAFLRRCLQLEMPEPDVKQLTNIVKSYFNLDSDTLKKVEKLIQDFVKRRERGQNLATDQLLNLIFMLTGDQNPSEADRQVLRKHLLQSLDRVRG